MTPPPPRPDDDSPPPPVAPAAGWEEVDPVPPPARDPLLDDPLFADLVEAKPAPDLTLEPDSPPPLPVAVPVEAVPVAEEVELPRATPVTPGRPRSAVTPPPRRAPSPREQEEPADLPRPRVFAACAVLGCSALSLFAALAFLAYAAIALLSGLNDARKGGSVATAGIRPEPVTATKYSQPSGVIALPGVVDGVGRAAGGRYLLLKTSRTKQLAMFDPVAGQTVHNFNLGESRALFAGSASKLFVYRPGEVGAELERWDLETRQQEFTAAKPMGIAIPDAMVVGAGSDGPVYLLNLPDNGKATIRVLNPDTLLETAKHTINDWVPKTPVHARISDDGSVLSVPTSFGVQVVRFTNPQTSVLLTLSGRGKNTPWLATPARDGQLIYTPFGLYDSTTGAPKAMPKAISKAYTFPTAHGTDLFLSQGRKLSGSLTDQICLHLKASPDDAVTLEDVEGPLGEQAGEIPEVPNDQRVHLWPAAGLAAVVTTGSPTQLKLTKVDVPALLKDIKDPYLVVGSDPPVWVGSGAEWRYRPVVWTNAAGAPSVSVVAGPPGMQVDGNREITWKPGPGAPRSVAVRIQVAAGDQQTEQRFRVTVLDDPEVD